MIDRSMLPNTFAFVVTAGAVESLPYVAPPPDVLIIPTTEE